MFLTWGTWSPDRDAAQAFMERMIETGNAIELDRIACSLLEPILLPALTLNQAALDCQRRQCSQVGNV